MLARSKGACALSRASHPDLRKGGYDAWRGFNRMDSVGLPPLTKARNLLSATRTGRVRPGRSKRAQRRGCRISAGLDHRLARSGRSSLRRPRPRPLPGEHEVPGRVADGSGGPVEDAEIGRTVHELMVRMHFAVGHGRESRPIAVVVEPLTPQAGQFR